MAEQEPAPGVITMAMVAEKERLEVAQRHAQLLDIFQELPETVQPKHAMKFFEVEKNVQTVSQCI